MKKKDNMQYFDLFKQYDELKTSDKLIDNNKLISTTLLNANLGYQSEQYKEFLANFELARNNRWYIKFDKFVIGFAQNLRFGSLALLPVLIDQDDSSVETLNLCSNLNNQFLTTFNEIINQLLETDVAVEVVEGIILFNSEVSNEIKLFFSKEWISYLRIENGTR
ncbi:MSC_0623 family F1-like ATPase-associated protein [Mycoplasma phocimorsus]|uniref:MSC_0623 family F1-like ATPase-associated protein n=1 Tax=Mycoplasma phocimorsus TaxID=3045839 RepID=UPI0024C0CA02|nr:DUF2714 domain-containing protein [Mycoplasma phocimorsus]MDJ1648108.1 DUF2714 domain-containing protein [Mycoplasma phocimorsus]